MEKGLDSIFRDADPAFREAFLFLSLYLSWDSWV